VGHSNVVELPARTVLVAAGTTPNITYEKGAPGHVQARREEEVLPAAPRVERTTATARRARRSARSRRLLHLVRHDGGKLVTYYGDNHPRYAGNVVKAMASAKDGYPHVVALFADELMRARSGDAAGARRAPGAAGRARSTRSFSRASRTSCA
jgi:hypothetical protein